MKQHAPRAADGARKNPPSCGHPERKHVARDKCWACYNEWLLTVNPEAKCKRNPITEKNAQLKYMYGISLAEYHQMVANQGGLCYTCKKPPSGKYKVLYVDHDHKTNAVRKLLCNDCNQLLGHAKDDPQLLIILADYLVEHQ